MITVSYGLHRKKSEILVAEMMEELAKESYENLYFLNLRSKSWKYLGSRTKDFVFDVHGGEYEQHILSMKLTIPRPGFILFSDTTEKKYLEFLKKYKISFILLSHKNKMLCHDNLVWAEAKIADTTFLNSSLEYVRKCDLEDRLIGIELLNASEKEQIEDFHRPFIKSFLRDLDYFSKNI